MATGMPAPAAMKAAQEEITKQTAAAQQADKTIAAQQAAMKPSAEQAAKAKDLKEGAAMAAKSLDSGEAEGRLQRLIRVSNS